MQTHGSSFTCSVTLFVDLSHQDMGTVILGKLESGSISKAQQLVMMPNRVRDPTRLFFHQVEPREMRNEGEKAQLLLNSFFGVVVCSKCKNPNVAHWLLIFHLNHFFYLEYVSSVMHQFVSLSHSEKYFMFLMAESNEVQI